MKTDNQGLIQLIMIHENVNTVMPLLLEQTSLVLLAEAGVTPTTQSTFLNSTVWRVSQLQ